MIVGLGSDIVNIERVAELLEKDKSGKGFKEKRFTFHEIESSKKYAKENKKKYYAHFAKRFAAKEAFAKAIGTGFGKYLSFSDIGIVNDEFGNPSIILNEKAEKLMQSLAVEGSLVKCHVSLSDDYPYALAVVILEG